MDLLPTVLEFAGVEKPSPMDGRSLVKLLEDPERSNWPDSLLVEHYGLNTPQFQRMLRWQYYKYVAQEDGFEELYDLENDPYELHNLALEAVDEHPLLKMRIQLINEMKSSEKFSLTMFRV